MAKHQQLFLVCVALVLGLNVVQVNCWRIERRNYEESQLSDGVHGSSLGLPLVQEPHFDQPSTDEPVDTFDDVESSEEDEQETSSGQEDTSAPHYGHPSSHGPVHYGHGQESSPSQVDVTTRDYIQPYSTTIQPRSNDTVIGCYRDSYDRELKGTELYLDRYSMTYERCVNHCFQQQYRYAGLEVGEECYCDNDYGRQGVSTNCNRRCTGNRDQVCGGDWALTILSTGYDGPAPAEREARPCDWSRPAVINGNSGWIASPYYPSDYFNNAQCAWLINAASPNGVLSITFPSVRTESCCDYVYVYDGNSTNAPRLGEVRGQTSGSTTFTTTQSQLFVTFRTDSSVTYSGFNATYWAPVDTTGNIVSYMITTEIDRPSSYVNDTDVTISIILYGTTGASLELELVEGIYQQYRSTFVFTDVKSVGIIKCVDFKLTGSERDTFIRVNSVRIEGDDQPPVEFVLERYYTVDSTTSPPSHGCGTRYTVRVSTGNQVAADSSARISVTLIGSNGKSAELIPYNTYFYRGGANEYTFNLPQLGDISCVNLRRFDSGPESNWFASSVSVSNQADWWSIDVNQWVPSKSNIPNGIVACVNGSTHCLDNPSTACPLPPALEQFSLHSKSEIIQSLVNADLIDICPSIEDLTSCASSFAKVNAQCLDEQQRLSETEQQLLQASSLITQRLCGSNIAEFSCQKGCLLQTNEDGQLILPEKIARQCIQYAGTDFEFPFLCQPHEFVDCAQKVIAKQCNEEIAEVITDLYGEISSMLCEPSTKPACPYDFKKSDAGCHKLVSDPQSWNSAAYRCSQFGSKSHLVFVNSDDEEQAVDGLLQQYNGLRCGDGDTGLKTAWTGGRRRSWPPAYQWYYDEITPTQLACRPGINEAGSPDGENDSCLKIRTDSSTSVQWKGAPCYYQFCYICEVDL